tara:strand:- start:491 stop:1969 length:1479 start_codon:yes stop_codon:yes gene_type:complete
MMLLRILVLWLLVYCSYSKADCLPDTEGLCTPGVTVTEDIQVEVTEEDLGTEIVTTTTTTTTTTTQTVTNEDSGDILDGSNGYVVTNKEGDMDIDWGGQGPASMPTGNNCYGLGADKCAMITGSGNSTSSMGVAGMGTTFIQTVDISDLNIQKGGEVRYTIEVDKQDAQDRIYMHIKGLNGNSQVFSGTDILSESGISSGYQSYNGSFDFSGILNRLTIEVGGRDINLAVGPVFDDVTVNVFYNVINTIITQQITTVEEIYYLDLFSTTELEFAEEVFEFNDISFDDVGDIDFTPIEPETEEVTYETVELEIQEFEIDFEIDLPEPELVSVEIETEMELELEIEMEMEIDLPEPEVEETIDEQPTEETTEPDSETTEEPTMETENSSEQEDIQQEEVEEPKEPVKEQSAKEKAATKIVKKIDDKARYDESNQMKTLIVMQILGNTKTFFDTQSTIQDTDVNEYLNKTIEDNYGVLFDMAQGQTMEDMINAQY